jgi:hypothetical protein
MQIQGCGSALFREAGSGSGSAQSQTLEALEAQNGALEGLYTSGRRFASIGAGSAFALKYNVGS